MAVDGPTTCWKFAADMTHVSDIWLNPCITEKQQEHRYRKLHHNHVDPLGRILYYPSINIELQAYILSFLFCKKNTFVHIVYYSFPCTFQGHESDIA